MDARAMDLPQEAMATPKVRIKTLDALRGAAVLLVVLTHATSWGNYGVIDQNVASINWAFTVLRMPILFVISGFLAHKYAVRDSARVAPRVAFLGWLYSAWVLLTLLIKSAHQSDYQITIRSIVYQMFAPSTPLWFIWALIILIMSLPLVRLANRLLIIAFFGIVSTLDYGGYLGDLQFAQSDLLRYAVMFYLGAFFAPEIKSSMHEALSWKKLLLLLMAFVIVHLIGHVLRSRFEWQVFGAIERISICCLVIYGGKLLHYLGPLEEALRWFGARTLQIYVAHVPLIWGISYVSPNLSSISSAIMPFIIVALAVAGSLLLHNLFKRMGLYWLYELPRWLERLINGASYNRRPSHDVSPSPSTLT